MSDGLFWLVFSLWMLTIFLWLLTDSFKQQEIDSLYKQIGITSIEDERRAKQLPTPHRYK